MKKFQSWTCSAELLTPDKLGELGYETGGEGLIDLSCDGVIDLDEAKSLINWLQCVVKVMEKQNGND